MLEARGWDVGEPGVAGVADGLAEGAEVVVGLHAARSLPFVAHTPKGIKVRRL